MKRIILIVLLMTAFGAQATAYNCVDVFSRQASGLSSPFSKLQPAISVRIEPPFAADIVRGGETSTVKVGAGVYELALIADSSSIGSTYRYHSPNGKDFATLKFFSVFGTEHVEIALGPLPTHPIISFIEALDHAASINTFACSKR